MAQFKDGLGREWVIRIDTVAFREVRERCRFELGKILNNNMKGLTELLSDAELLVNVLYVLIADQAEKVGVSDEQFGRSLTGDALDEASNALIGAYADFCPSQIAQPLRALLAKTRDLGAEASRRALEQIEKLTLNGSPGSSPESAESTLAPVG